MSSTVDLLSSRLHLAERWFDARALTMSVKLWLPEQLVRPVFSERLEAALLAEGADVRRGARRRALGGRSDGGGQRRLRGLCARDRALVRAGPLRRLVVFARAEEDAAGAQTRPERGPRAKRVARVVHSGRAAGAAGAALRRRRLPRVRQLLPHVLELSGAGQKL